uniref:Uncharacterized protein n=1 Tax=Triticum urartu TaxID=4572 RepID=A0A8R7V8F4_TRIUA
LRIITFPGSQSVEIAPPVCPKIEQVFTLANTHRHRTPHPGYHAVHMAMAARQHGAMGSTHEHHATTTRAAAPASKTSTPPHSIPATTPTEETSGPRGKLASIDSYCCIGRETNMVLLP